MIFYDYKIFSNILSVFLYFLLSLLGVAEHNILMYDTYVFI